MDAKLDTSEGRRLRETLRGRLRRRRTTMAGAGVLAGAVIIAPFLLNQSDPPSRGVDEIATNPTSPAVVETPDGLRTESWHDVTFQVPDDWGYGAPTGQCLSSASFPSVGRPGDLVPSIDCAGPGYGAVVETSAPETYEPASGDVWQYPAPEGFEPKYPDQAWVGIWYDDEVAVTVATPDEELTRQIVASVQVIDGVDDNGCAPRRHQVEAEFPDGTDSMSVCRYDAADELGWSWRLTVEEATRLGDAVKDAPVPTIDYDCPDEEGLGAAVIVQSGVFRASVGTDTICEDGDVRQVTDEVRAAIERPAPTS